MKDSRHGFVFSSMAVLASALLLGGCGQPPATNTVATNSTNINTASNANSNANSSTVMSGMITATEPEQYQGNVKITFESLAQGGQKATLPVPLGAMVARSGTDRVMEFQLPTNEKVIYLDKGGMNYVILPNRKQYAELAKESLGFEVRRLLMPEEIVQQVKAIPGIRLVGEETQNGRTVVKYAYNTSTNTQTQAGTVATESYVLVDKETGLPIRSETVSQSQSGGNVQGISGIRVVTEMTDIKTSPDASLFMLPTDYQKIDPEQVKAQATLVFNTVAAFIGQMVQQAQTQNAPAANASPMVSPAR